MYLGFNYVASINLFFRIIKFIIFFLSQSCWIIYSSFCIFDIYYLHNLFQNLLEWLYLLPFLQYPATVIYYSSKAP